MKLDFSQIEEFITEIIGADINKESEMIEALSFNEREELIESLLELVAEKRKDVPPLYFDGDKKDESQYIDDRNDLLREIVHIESITRRINSSMIEKEIVNLSNDYKDRFSIFMPKIWNSKALDHKIYTYIYFNVMTRFMLSEIEKRYLSEYWVIKNVLERKKFSDSEIRANEDSSLLLTNLNSFIESYQDLHQSDYEMKMEDEAKRDLQIAEHALNSFIQMNDAKTIEEFNESRLRHINKRMSQDVASFRDIFALPEIKGVSAKQVAFAEDCRIKVIEMMDKYDLIDELDIELEEEDSARFWIDRYEIYNKYYGNNKRSK